MELQKEGGPLVIKPPTDLNVGLNISMPKIFLAGSIEQGKATDWQQEVVNSLSDLNVLFLNPRRDHWDSSWKQEKSNPNFNYQVNWELEGLERADKIIVYFEPTTLAPITFGELCLHARSGKLIVCCPEGYWRKGNVDIVCERYGIKMVESLKDLVAALREEYREKP